MTKEASESLGASGELWERSNRWRICGKHGDVANKQIGLIYSSFMKLVKNPPNNSIVKLLWNIYVFIVDIVDMFIATEEQTMAKKSTNKHIASGAPPWKGRFGAMSKQWPSGGILYMKLHSRYFLHLYNYNQLYYTYMYIIHIYIILYL